MGAKASLKSRRQVAGEALRRRVSEILPPLLLGLAAALASAAATAANVYSFAVVPQFEQRKLFAIWKPIVDDLEKRTGLAFKLEATLTVPEFEHEVTKGTFDFLYANPYHILRTAKTQGYIPLVRDRAPLRGILVVQKDSPITTPAELAGMQVAFPSPNALGACLLIRVDLAKIYGVTIKPLYVQTHSSVYLHVANGLVPAGGGVEKTLEEQDPEVRDALRVLYTTREMPSHPIAAHPRVPAGDREKVRRALLEMAESEEGARLLSEVPIKHLVSASIADYTAMREWGLEPLWVEEK